MPDRLTDMLARYGEAVTRTEAARILGRSRSWVYDAINDGRLATVCAGQMVDVRSIAAYLEEPSANDYRARLRRRNDPPANDAPKIWVV